MIEPTKKDWKLYREKIAVWQENYMERLVEQYSELLSGDLPASAKFWELFGDEVKEAVRLIAGR